MIKHSARIITLFILLVPLLSACSGGNPNGNGSSLDVTISGLPAGIEAAVTVSGPASYHKTLTTSRTLTGLAPGQYTVTADNVIIGADVYAPTVKGSPANVSAGQTASAMVSYKHVASSTGSLLVNISVPAGAPSPAVTITGPYYKNTINASTTLPNLVPGSYTVTAPSIIWKGHTLKPSIKDSPATVKAGSTASVTVSYPNSSNGNLSVTISGLPSGVDANITVTGPDGFSKKVTASQTIPNLIPGSYTVKADSVTVSGDVGKDVYTGMVSGSPVTIQEGNTPSVSVSYTTTTGDLKATIGGLPDGTDANVTVSGPNGYSQQLTATATLRGLTPGDYTVSAQPILVGDSTFYTPSIIGSPATVAAGQAADASVAYNPPNTGSLSVTVTGLPDGVDADVTVSGPGGYNHKLTGSNVLSGLVPGNYSVTANNVKTGGFTYAPTISDPSVTVTAGETADSSVTYKPITGGLTVTITSPTGVTPSVEVTGPNGFDQTITKTQSFDDIAPGSYTIAPQDVSFNNETYHADGSTTTVKVGQQAQGSVAYSQATGDLTIAISGLPDGASGSVQVTGPGNYSQPLPSNGILKGLTPGTYTLTPADVLANNETYSAPISMAVVTAGGVTSQTVAYTQSTGDLTVTIDSSTLPPGAEANVTVSGPNAYDSGQLASTTTLHNLVPGSYTVTAHDVTPGTVTYGATVNPPTATVSAGQTAGPITVTYAAKGFSISLSSTTLNIPFDGSGPPVTVTVTRTGGFTGAVDVSLNNPPTGISASSLTIPSGQNSGTLTLSSDSTVTSVNTPMTVTVQGTSGSFSDSASLSVTVVPEVTSAADSGAGTLRDLIANVPTSAANPTTITFDPTVFADPTTITLNSTLTIAQDLTIQGPTDAAVMLSGNNAVQVMSVSTGVAATISNLTIAGGSSNKGGGINNAGTLTIQSSSISGNTANNGGGIANSGTLTLINSTISGNAVSGFGSIGGGVDNSGTLTLTNSTVSDNTASGLGSIGGGVDNSSTGSLTLKNTIVAGNTAGGAGPDIFNGPSTPITSDDYNLIGDGSNSNFTNAPHDLVGTSMNPIDPLLGALADNGGPTETMALQSGSPAIDQIPASACTDTDGNAITTDQRGEPRPSPAGGMCDIGAFERQPSD